MGLGASRAGVAADRPPPALSEGVRGFPRRGFCTAGAGGRAPGPRVRDRRSAGRGGRRGRNRRAVSARSVTRGTTRARARPHDGRPAPGRDRVSAE